MLRQLVKGMDSPPFSSRTIPWLGGPRGHVDGGASTSAHDAAASFVPRRIDARTTGKAWCQG